LSDINETCILSIDLKKKSQLSDSIKIRGVGVELMQTDARTDRRDEANTHF